MTGLPRPVRSEGGARYVVTGRARLVPDTPPYLEARVAPRGGAYIVRRLVATGPPETAVRINVGEPQDINVADFSYLSFYVADYYQPLYVEPSLPLVLQWFSPDASAPLDAGATFRVELEEL